MSKAEQSTTDAPADEAAEPGPINAAAAGMAADREVERAMHHISRRSFLWALAAGGSGYGALRWLDSRRADDGIPWPFRRVLQTNEELARDWFSASRLAPEFPVRRDANIRQNGDIGLGEGFDPARWKLEVKGLADANAPVRHLLLQEIKALPRVEITTELKCIEGWSIIVSWAGARFVDFLRHYPPATPSGRPADPAARSDDLPGYVALTTPDGAYYVGLEMAAALHPQTLLCYEMNGRPLTVDHGAPLRLAVPVKYGIKNLKRIGTISYANSRPADYWAEQGYDWYAGH